MIGGLDPISMLVDFVTKLEPVMAIMSAFGQIIEVINAVLTPVTKMIKDALGPAINALGKVIGTLLLPVFWILGKAIEVISGIIIIVATVIASIINAVITGINFVLGIFGVHLDGINIDNLTKSMPGTDSESKSKSSRGPAGATYTAAPVINYNVTINTDVITGQGGIRDLAILLNKEIAAAAKLTDTSLVATGLHASPGTKWSDLTNSNPQIDIEDARQLLHKKSGVRPNTLVMSEPVFNKLLFNKKLISVLGVTGMQMLSMEMLKRILNIENILVGSALKDTVAYGSSSDPSLDYVWGDSVVLCYIAPTVGRKTRTVGCGFYWTAKGTNGVGVRKWWDQAKQATKVEGEHWYDLKIISDNSSYIFEDVLA
jgi:hypothetical protein